MSDAALSEPRAAALESPAPSNAMRPTASKTWRGWRADVRRSHRAAGMETRDARKTWGGWRADVDSCGPAKLMQTAAPTKTWRRWRADVGNSEAGAMKLMKIAAAKPAVDSAAGKPGGDGRGSGVETGRGVNATRSKLTKPWTTAEGRSAHTTTQTGGRDASAQAAGRRTGIHGVLRLGMRNDDAVVMMAPNRRAHDRGGGAKTVAPLIAARIVAGTVRAIVVPAIAAVLDFLHE